jgi:hypothetical protein
VVGLGSTVTDEEILAICVAAPLSSCKAKEGEHDLNSGGRK